MKLDVIQNKIYEIRGLKVMLDFMFQLTKEEWENLKSQFVTSRWGGTRKLPYAFTEQGLAMLSGVLNSDIAINVNIHIMRAFVEIRKLVKSANVETLKISQLSERMKTLEDALCELSEDNQKGERCKIANCGVAFEMKIQSRTLCTLLTSSLSAPCTSSIYQRSQSALILNSFTTVLLISLERQSDITRKEMSKIVSFSQSPED